jgi:DNA-binding transcriptional MerR regulator
LLHLGDEEPFTTLLQQLPEEDKRLLEQFEDNPVNDLGLIEEELKHLLKVADALGLIEKPDEISSTIKHCMKDPPLSLKPSEVAPYSRTQFLQSFTMIIRRMLMKLSAFPLVSMPPREIPDHYPHTSVPEHAPRLVGEGKAQIPKNGVVFDSNHAGLLFDALADPNHQYRQRAVQLVRRFGAAVEKEKAQDIIKDKGIAMEQASRKYGVPASTLRDWEEMGLLTVLYRGKGKQGIYLDEAAVARAASIYEEARQKGIQPARLLSELTQKGEEPLQLLQGITAHAAAREFNVPTNFLLRWAKELGIIPILSQGTGRGSATFLDREKAREVAEIYHEAKRQKIQPKKLLERMSAG